MCTLVLIHQPSTRHPLIIAANRDEHPSRPSLAPHCWKSDPSIYAPKDLVRGGSWIGLSRFGLFAALTNRDEVEHLPGKTSRGLLVIEALRAHTLSEALHRIQHLSGTDFNGFHLLIGTRAELLLLAGNGTTIQTQRLSSGLHVITGYGFTPAHAPRAAEIERRYDQHPRDTYWTPEDLDALLNFHANGDPRHAACVHDPNEFHKTCSSLLIRMRNDHQTDVWDRTGSACSGPFHSHRRLAA